MGNLADQVTIWATTCARGSGFSRNDLFTQASTLTAYSTDVRTLATPVYANIVAERTSAGGARTATPTSLGGIGATTACDVRVEIGIGQQSQATPQRFHLVVQSLIADREITSAQVLVDYISKLILQQIPVNTLAPGRYYL